MLLIDFGIMKNDKDSNDKPITNNSFVNWFDNLSKIKNGIFVFATLMYITGYFIWTFYAWKNQVGLLPLLDTQYFLTGFIPVLVLGMMLGGIYYRQTVTNNLPSWMDLHDSHNLSLRKRRARKIINVINICALILSILLLVIHKYAGLNLPTNVVAALIFCLFVPLMISTFLGVFEYEIERTRKAKIFTIVFLSVWCGIFLLIFYALEVYPRIPQEFGGTKPRCVLLDLKVEQLTPETARDVLDTYVVQNIVDETGFSPKTKNVGVLRSIPVDLLYSKSSSLIIQARSSTYELSTSSVLAITPCPSTPQ